MSSISHLFCFQGCCCWCLSMYRLLLAVIPCLFLLLPGGCTSEHPAQQPVLVYTVQEEQPVNTVFGNLREDSGIRDKYTAEVFATLRFEFYQSNAASEMFVLEPETGVLMTRVKIDREMLCTVPSDDCDVLLLDVKVLPYTHFQIIKMKIVIVDVNDNAPSFPTIRLDWTVSESAAIGTELPMPTAEDPDSGVRGVQIYELVNELDTPFTLHISNHSHSMPGDLEVTLVLREKLDREIQSSYRVQINAWDGGKPPLHGSVWVDVHVADANDNSPVFDSVRYEATIAEHSPAGTEVVRVHASDADAGLYGMVTYKFVPETEVLYGHLFAINNRTGRVYVRNDALNREEGHTYPLGVMATDDGLGSLPTFAKIVVHVRDVNDNAPQIVVSTLTDSGYAEVAENAPSGTLVAYITVSDADLGPSGELQCSLDNNNFELQQIAGSSGDYKMISAVAFDREIQDTYVVGVTCHDGGQPRMTSAKNVVVRVTDENDNGPQFGQSVYVVSVREGNAVGALLIRLNATDRDTGRNSDIKYNVADNDAVYVDTAGGTVRARIVFDYELQTRFQFVVTAEDKGVKPRSASATIILDILDANDNVPEFHADAYEFAVPENLLPHSPVGTVNASDADSYRHNSIIYTIDPPGMHFDVDQYTGVIVTRSELDRELRDVYHLRLAAYNPELPDVKGYVNVTVNVSDVNDNAPTVVFPQSPNNTAYVSTRAARGFVLTSLVAYDRDSGDNGRLKYVVDKQHSDITASLYDVSPDSGQVTVVGDLTDRDLLVTRLHIIVRDRGLPFRETRADLYVVISEPDYEHDAIMAGDMGAGGRLMSRSNLLVVIAIVCGTTAVILTIVAIMCLTHRRDDRRDRRMQEDTGKRLEDSGDALFTQLPPPGDTQQQMTMMMRSQGEYGGGCTDVYQQQQRHRLLQPLTSVEGNGAITSYSDKQGHESRNGTLRRDRTLAPKSEVIYYVAAPTVDEQCLSPNAYTSPVACCHPRLKVASVRSENGSESGSCTDSGQGASDEGDTWCPRLAPDGSSISPSHATSLPLRETQQLLCNQTSLSCQRCIDDNGTGQRGGGACSPVGKAHTSIGQSGSFANSQSLSGQYGDYGSLNNGSIRSSYHPLTSPSSELVEGGGGGEGEGEWGGSTLERGGGGGGGRGGMVQADGSISRPRKEVRFANVHRTSNNIGSSLLSTPLMLSSSSSHASQRYCDDIDS